MKRNLISLSRNKTNKNLNLFLLSSEKEEKKQIFKTIQNESRTIPTLINKYYNGLKNKTFKENFTVNNYDKCLKNKNNKDFPTKLIFKNFPDSKIISPISNSIRYNYSIQRFKHNKYSFKKYKGSMSYSEYNPIKLKKPKLLKSLNKKLIDKILRLKDSSIKWNTLITTSKEVNKDILKFNNYVYNKNITNDNIQINNFFNTKLDNLYNLKEIYQQLKLKDTNSDSNKNLLKSFKKMKKLNIKFPLEFPNNLYFEKSELRDKVNIDYYNNEEIKKKIRKALYYEINSFDYDNGIYLEYKKSIPNFINFIYDINILPHLKNKFLYNKPIKQTQINEIIFNRNAISRKVAESLNRYIINNIRKKILEKEEIKRREKRMRELAKSKNILLKLYMERKDEDLPDLTSGEIVELNDFFGKNIDYNYIKIANNDRLRKIVYDENNYKYK